MEEQEEGEEEEPATPGTEVRGVAIDGPSNSLEPKRQWANPLPTRMENLHGTLRGAG